jgi:acyl-ACP thioesterase
MISATSAWAVLDRSTGRPQRIDRIDGGFPWQPDRNEMDTDLKKVPELPAGLPLARFRVLSSDIDTNGHVNSTSYLRWIVDSQPRAKLEASELEGIELSFLDEALPSDEVEVVSDQGTGAEPGAGIELCCIRRTGDQMELFRARLKWRMVGEAEPHR